MSHRGAVIFNPTSGRGRGARLQQAAQALLGDRFVWIPTERAGHAVELSRQAAIEHQIVVACGGDGTVGDVMRGIRQATRDVESAPALGILPFGTGNDVARNLNLPREVEPACRVLLGGNVRRIDLGQVNDVPFINNAGTGFDAQVMNVMNTSIRFVRGKPAFYLAILKTLPGFQPIEFRLSGEGFAPRSLSAMMVAVLNGPVFAAGMKAAPQAQLDDGLLDVLIIKAMSKWRLLPLIGLVTRGSHAGHPAIEMFRIRSLRIETNSPQPINIDGDVRGQAPMQIDVLPRALKVLV